MYAVHVVAILVRESWEREKIGPMDNFGAFLSFFLLTYGSRSMVIPIIMH